MGSPVAFLRDDFSDSLIATAWNAVASGSATVAETGGQARFTLPSSTAGTHTARYTSRVSQNITGDWFVFNTATMVSTAVAATAFYQLYKDGSNLLNWVQINGTLFARSVVGGVSTDRYSAAWNATTYKYLAVAEGAGTITFWSSANGTTWVSRATLVAPFPVTDLYIDFGATCGNVASPGSFRLDDVNLILPALTTTWRWIQVRWPLDERGKTVTTATAAANTIQGYVVTADGVDASDNPSGNVRYFSGPMDGGRVLTEQLTQAAAQAMAVNIPLDGRIDLPEMVEGRCTRVYFRSMTGSSVTWRELYPRRLIQADDIEAEIIRGMTILGHQLVADKLSAMTANIGQLVIDPDGYLWQGTGTALAPGTGLKIFEVGGVGKLSTYNGGVEQVTLDTDGRLKAGAGSIVLDVNGAAIEVTTTLTQLRSYQFQSASVLQGALYGAVLATGPQLTLRTERITGKSGEVNLLGWGGASQGGAVRLEAGTSAIDYSSLSILSGTSGHGVRISGGVNPLDWCLSVSGGLNLGTATGAGTGQLITSGVIAINGAPINAAISLNAKGTGVTNATAAIKVVNSASAVNFQALDDGTITTRKGNRWDIGAYVGGGTLTATGLTAVTIDGTAHFFLSR